MARRLQRRLTRLASVPGPTIILCRSPFSTAWACNVNSLPLADTAHRLLNCGGNCGSPSGFTDPYRNYPGFTDITEFQNIAVSRYSGLQSAVTLQTRHGLNAGAQYTWSHATDDGQGDNAGNPTNPYSMAY